MNKISVVLFLAISTIFFVACGDSAPEKKEEKISDKESQETKMPMMQVSDERLSLGLNPMQKQHQLKNMRSHLEAVQEIIVLLSSEDFDQASELAYTKLGSTTEMKLMCASFGDKKFENLGLAFHESADEMSEIFKKRDKNESLKALSNTMNYCVQCHATFRQ